MSELARDLRVGPLTNIEKLLRSLGCEPKPVFDASGFKPEQFLDTNERVSYIAATRLIANCAAVTGCNQFGLLLGQYFLTSHLGIAGRLAQTAPDVATALRDIIDNLDLHDRGAVATLDTLESYTSFRYEITLPGITAVEQVYDLSVTNMCGIMRSLCGMDWAPKEVHLSRAEPENTRPYLEYFRAPVRFNALESSLIFSSEYLKQRLFTTDIEYHQHLSEDVRRLHDEMPPNLSAKVRDSLRRNLSGDTNTAAAVANTFGLHERTLNRRLRSEGTSFRIQLDQVRQSTSQHYLAGTALPVSDIAMALGYGSTDAFDHAFRRWFDQSPSEWRRSCSPLA